MLKWTRLAAMGEKMKPRAAAKVRAGGWLLLILLVSLASPSAPYHAVAGDPNPAEWTTMNANANSTNYVAQSQIVASSAKDLRVAWTEQSGMLTQMSPL